MDTPDPTSTLPPPPPPPPPFPTRRLRRRKSEGQIAGVCAGIADYLGVDVTVVRLVAIILAITGPGIPAYLIAWIAVPLADPNEPRTTDASLQGFRLTDRVPQAIGIGLLLLAAVVVWDSWDWPGQGFLFPLTLIAAGVLLLFRTPSGDDEDSGTLISRPTVAPAAPPAPAPAVDSAPAAPSAPRRRPRQRTISTATAVTLGALLVWTGLAVLADVDIVTGLAIGVAIVAAGLVVGAFVGGARGLVFPGIAISLALVGTAAISVPIKGGTGDHTWTVDTIDDIGDPFRLAAGEGTLDLRELRPPAERVVEIEATIAFGRLEVRLPEGVPVHITASADAGDIRLPGRDEESGIDVDAELDESSRVGVGTLELDLAVGFGEVEVVR